MLHGELTRRIVRACHIVHRELGHGFLESVYEAAVARVLSDAGSTVERQAALEVIFRGASLGTFRADLVVDHVVLVELKAGRALAPEHLAQVINYLRASRLQVGLLAHFGQRLTVRRLILDAARTPPCRPAPRAAAPPPSGGAVADAIRQPRSGRPCSSVAEIIAPPGAET